MKKIVFVAWILSFGSADVFGMLPNRKESRESTPLKECKEGLVANPSAEIVDSSAKSGNSRKRELSPSCEEAQENQKRRESKADGSITDSRRVVGLRKRIGIKEKENKELLEKIVSLTRQKEKGELTIKAVSSYLDNLMNKHKDLINSDPAFMEHYRRLGTVVEKVEFLMSSAILKLEEHSKSISKLNRILGIGVEEVQKLQRKNESNEKRISELEQKEKKYQELSGQIDQLSQVVQNQGDKFEQINRVVQNQGDKFEQINRVVQNQGDKFEQINRVVQNQGDKFEQINRVVQNQKNGFEQMRQGVPNQGNIMDIDENKILEPKSDNYSVGPSGYSVEQNAGQKVSAGEVSVAVGASNVENHALRGDEELFENAAARVKIKGRFIDGYLDFSKPVWFEGEYLKNKQFVFSGEEARRLDFISNSKKIKISKEDLSQISYTREKNNRLLLVLLKGTGDIILCNEFVYQGAVDREGKPSGSGIMLKSTGEVVEGKKSAEEWLRM